MKAVATVIMALCTASLLRAEEPANSQIVLSVKSGRVWSPSDTTPQPRRKYFLRGQPKIPQDTQNAKVDVYEFNVFANDY